MYKIFDKPIDIDKPDFVIPLRTLQSPVDVYKFCRYHNLTAFGYGFRFVRNSYMTEQLKFGYSAPSPNARSSIQRGERLVRQIAWLPGWPTNVSSSHGFEFWHGCTDLINREILPKDTNYTDIEIAIWSVASRNNVSGYSMTAKKCAEFIESELSDQYKERYGSLPWLNIADPTNNKTHKALAKSTFLKMFDFTEL